MDKHKVTWRSVDKLKPHPKNYRDHPEEQISHLAQSIKEHGVYRNVVTAKDGTILAGHGVVAAAKKLKLKQISVIQLDIEPDDPQAIKLLVGDNLVVGLSEDNDRELSELLKGLNEENNLLGSGFTEEMLANFAMITRDISEIKDYDAAAEWVGMPDYSESERESFRVIVHFETEETRTEFVKLIGADKHSKVGCSKGNAMSFQWPLREEANDWESIRFETNTEEEVKDAK